MIHETDAVLVCGCVVVLAIMHDEPICDCCAPADPFISGGHLTRTCPAHTTPEVRH